jgi:inositol-phosphate transport system substrate-binding protein
MGKRTVEGRTEVDDVYRLSRRHFLIGTGALIAATACSTAPQQPATQNLPEGAVKLTAWTIGPDAPSYYRRDNLIAAGESLTKAISAQNPKTSIQVDATFESGGQWGDYLQKFTLAAEAKTAPDIILAGHENFAPWVGPGYVVPLDDLIKKYQNEGGVKDVIPTLWNAMKLKGKTYGVPQDTEARPMYYRKDLLAKMGWS